jgi:hypothetical protein
MVSAPGVPQLFQYEDDTDPFSGAPYFEVVLLCLFGHKQQQQGLSQDI